MPVQLPLYFSASNSDFLDGGISWMWEVPVISLINHLIFCWRFKIFRMEQKGRVSDDSGYLTLPPTRNTSANSGIINPSGHSRNTSGCPERMQELDFSDLRKTIDNLDGFPEQTVGDETSYCGISDVRRISNSATPNFADPNKPGNEDSQTENEYDTVDSVSRHSVISYIDVAAAAERQVELPRSRTRPSVVSTRGMHWQAKMQMWMPTMMVLFCALLIVGLMTAVIVLSSIKCESTLRTYMDRLNQPPCLINTNSFIHSLSFLPFFFL